MGVKKKYDGPSMEERVAELVGILEDGVRTYTQSPEAFKALLAMKAMMPTYSMRNLIVAKAQFPNGSFFASFKRWNELGRQVRKGSKAIRIFAPRFAKKKQDDGSEETQLVGFNAVPVFAYEQTEGEPLPIEQVKIKLDGDCTEARQIIEWAERIAAQDNCGVSYGDAEGANGYYSPSRHEIAVSDGLSMNHRCKTLVHELVHSRVHRFKQASAEEMEVVAEGSAFVVCSFFGLDTSDYSFAYVKNWGKSEEAVMNYGSQICDIAGKLIMEFKTIIDESESFNQKEVISA